MTIEKKWRSFRIARKQLLTLAQRRKRLKFAREHEHLSAQDWENYIFSDESTKYLFHVPKLQDDTVWGLNLKMYLTSVVLSPVQK